MGVEYEPLAIVGFEFKDYDEYVKFCEQYSIEQDDEEFHSHSVSSGALDLWSGSDYVFGVILKDRMRIDQILEVFTFMVEHFSDNQPNFLMKQRVF